MYEFGERLKALRKRNGISQNALSKEMGLTRATVNAWEMEISSPNAQSLIMLAKFFKVSVDYLLGLDNSEMISLSQLKDNEKKIVCDLIDYMTSKCDE